MTEAPKTIHILTSDAVLFAQKYGHPKLELPCVGDVSDEYHHNDTVTALQAKVERLESDWTEAVTALEHVLAGKPVRNADEIIDRKALEETQ